MLLRLSKYLILSACISASPYATSQEHSKKNPIVYLEFFGGHAWGDAGGFSLGTALNYQVNQHFFTVQYDGNVIIRPGNRFYFLIPDYVEKSSLEEIALLYGQRFIKGGKAYSFSAGISYNKFRMLAPDKITHITTQTIGFPFQANIKWFQSKKERFRIYWLIPIGKPIGYGTGIGFKLYGNLSKKSYVALGIVFSGGWHKRYE